MNGKDRSSKKKDEVSIANIPVEMIKDMLRSYLDHFEDLNFTFINL